MGRVTDTISGGLATFRTPGKQAIRSLNAYFTPKQEGTGTPSPDNVRPISGWTGVNIQHGGKNLLDTSWLSDASAYNNAGSYGYVYTDPLYLKPNTNYYVSWQRTTEDTDPTCYWGLKFYTGSDYAPLDAGTFRYYVNGSSGFRTYTTAFNTGASGVVRFAVNFTSGGGYSTRQEALDDVFGKALFQLEEGTLPTAYEPYKTIATLSIDWSSAGTVYGGYVDLVTGEVWETWKYIDLTTQSWQQFGVGSSVITVSIFPGTISSRNNGFCNILPMVTNPNISGVEGCDWNGSRMNLCLSNSRGITTLAEFTAWLQSLKDGGTTPYVVAQYGQPQLVTTLTPTALRTLIGTNNIWCNSGDVSVEYDFAESREMQEARKRVMAFDAYHQIPTAYRKVEYIESSGTQWIDTGIVPDSTTQVQVLAETTTTNQDIPIFGVFVDDNSAGLQSLSTYYHLTPYSNKWYYGKTGQEGNAGTYSKTIGEQQKVVFNTSTGGITVNGTTITDGNNYNSVYGYHLAISFRGHVQGSYRRFGRWKYYYFKIRNKETGKLIADFVPCIRKADGKTGMYDRARKQFFPNNGTGEFIIPE